MKNIKKQIQENWLFWADLIHNKVDDINWLIQKNYDELSFEQVVLEDLKKNQNSNCTIITKKDSQKPYVDLNKIDNEFDFFDSKNNELKNVVKKYKKLKRSLLKTKNEKKLENLNEFVKEISQNWIYFEKELLLNDLEKLSIKKLIIVNVWKKNNNSSQNRDILYESLEKNVDKWLIEKINYFVESIKDKIQYNYFFVDWEYLIMFLFKWNSLIRLLFENKIDEKLKDLINKNFAIIWFNLYFYDDNEKLNEFEIVKKIKNWEYIKM